MGILYMAAYIFSPIYIYIYIYTYIYIYVLLLQVLR